MKDYARKQARFIRAEKLFIDPADLEVERQRNPEERIHKLIKLYGEKGQRWSDELAGAISVKERPNGMFAIKDGGGRWWAVMNLLKDPRKELLCVVIEETNDLEAFRALNAGTRMPDGQLFMARGHDPKNKYEHRVCNILQDHGFTTTPNRGPKTLRVIPVCFAYDLGVLNAVLRLIKIYWSRSPKSKKEMQIEGNGLAGIAAFMFLYRESPGFSLDRLEHVLAQVSFDELKEAARDFMPANKEHQRQWSVALCKELVRRYNLGLRHQTRLKPEEVATFQAKVLKHENYANMGAIWEMRKVVK